MDTRGDKQPVDLKERLTRVLKRCGVQVSLVRADSQRVLVELTNASGKTTATVFAVPRSPNERYYRITREYGFYYQAQVPEGAQLLAEIDLVIAIVERFGVHRLMNMALDRDQLFLSRFPFATVDRAERPREGQAVQVLVRVTGRCNQRCPFCSGPELPTDPTEEELFECFAASGREFPGCLLTLTGGEPTVRRNWLKVLERALEAQGIGGVQVQTNAVKFALPGFVTSVPSDPRLSFFVSLHAVDDALYDRITASRGMLPRALAGIRALLSGGHRVTLNVVVCSENYKHLPQMVSQIPSIFSGYMLPEVHLSVLMCPPHRPDAPKWLVPFEELVPYLRKAIEVGTSVGVRMHPLLASTHASVPPCFLTPEERACVWVRPILYPDETGYEDLSRSWVKANACKGCAADNSCLGVPKPYAVRYGLSGLSPFSDPLGERVVRVTAKTLKNLPDLVPYAVDQALEQHGGRVVLDIVPPEEVEAPDEPVSFSKLLDTMPPAFRFWRGGVISIKSRAGRPACLLSDLASKYIETGTTDTGTDHHALSIEPCSSCGVRFSCTGVSSEYLKRFGAQELRPLSKNATWKDRIRWLLTGRPEVSIPLGKFIPEKDLPNIPCTMPWTRIELHDGGTYGPCCSDYMNGRHFAPKGATLMDLWHSDLLRTYREELLKSERPAVCHSTCPLLQGRQQSPPRLMLHGGSPEAVENQIRLIEGLLERRVEADWLPLSLCIPVTTFCNYDCLMCDCGEKGTLSDEKDAHFWEGLDPFMKAGALLDANGGEPLASPKFRAWLRKIGSSGAWPQVVLVTNGSFLTPRFLSSFDVVPFRSLIVSLNAATPETYVLVNRGLPWSRIRQNLDAVLEARRTGKVLGEVVYSMVILQANLHEIVAFAELGIRDHVGVRYMLPQRNRNNQSIFVSKEAMIEAQKGLDIAAMRLESAGQRRFAEEARVHARILRNRLDLGLLEPIGNIV